MLLLLAADCCAAQIALLLKRCDGIRRSTCWDFYLVDGVRSTLSLPPPHFFLPLVDALPAFPVGGGVEAVLPARLVAVLEALDLETPFCFSDLICLFYSAKKRSVSDR